MISGLVLKFYKSKVYWGGTLFDYPRYIDRVTDVFDTGDRVMAYVYMTPQERARAWRAARAAKRVVIPEEKTVLCRGCGSVMTGTGRMKEHCAGCLRQAGAERADAYRKRRKAQADEENLPLIRARFESFGCRCVDCGTDDWRVMTWDHVDPLSKEAQISRLRDKVGVGEVLWAELLKCEPVCANCHAIRTMAQRGSGAGSMFRPPGE